MTYQNADQALSLSLGRLMDGFSSSLVGTRGFFMGEREHIGSPVVTGILPVSLAFLAILVGRVNWKKLPLTVMLVAVLILSVRIV